jgi:hypothetical protein
VLVDCLLVDWGSMVDIPAGLLDHNEETWIASLVLLWLFVQHIEFDSVVDCLFVVVDLEVIEQSLGREAVELSVVVQ